MHQQSNVKFYHKNNYIPAVMAITLPLSTPHVTLDKKNCFKKCISHQATILKTSTNGLQFFNQQTT
jgi:hypothetical protein